MEIMVQTNPDARTDPDGQTNGSSHILLYIYRSDVVTTIYHITTLVSNVI